MSGAHIPLAEFHARQTRRGVSAAPWGQRRVFPHTFIVEQLGGPVFKREGNARLPIRKLITLAGVEHCFMYVVQADVAVIGPPEGDDDGVPALVRIHQPFPARLVDA